MIDTIKVYGLRNSGTRYMEQLITHNIFSGGAMKDESGINGSMLGWKHGFPTYRPNTLYVVTLRPVHEWLRSMYSYPYECHRIKGKSKDFIDFITRPFYSSNRSGAVKYAGQFDNIIHMRTMKLQAYSMIWESWENAIFVNIEAAKKDPKLVARAFAQFDDLKLKRDSWFDITNSCSEPKVKERTRPNRYELTASDKEIIAYLLGKYGDGTTEGWVNNMHADAILNGRHTLL